MGSVVCPDCGCAVYFHKHAGAGLCEGCLKCVGAKIHHPLNTIQLRMKEGKVVIL